jgi:hypothetical protein
MRGGARVGVVMKQVMLLVLLLAVSAARADDWVSIGKTSDRLTRVYIDTSGIQIDGAMRRAWIRDVFRPHTKRKIAPQLDEWVDYAASHVIVNCDNSTFWEDSLLWFYENGEQAQVAADQISAQWRAINPVKIVDQEMKFICSWQPK